MTVKDVNKMSEREMRKEITKLRKSLQTVQAALEECLRLADESVNDFESNAHKWLSNVAKTARDGLAAISRKGVNWDDVPEKMSPSEIPIWNSTHDDE